MTDASAQDINTDVHSKVRDHYRQIAAMAESGGAADCCGPAAADPGSSRPRAEFEAAQATELYDPSALSDLPQEVIGLSLGCGDPVTLASLEAGQTVLDLGSGGGIDCFLAAKQVGESGHVIGVDMTPAMLERARANKAKLGVENVEFRMGEIEHLPVADGTVDVVISNCVIVLSPDKQQVFNEAFRVLRPGGRLAVSDIVSSNPPSDGNGKGGSPDLGDTHGRLTVDQYKAVIEAAGYVDVTLVPEEAGLCGGAEIPEGIFSAKIQARKANN